jgi:hypothetical protein
LNRLDQHNRAGVSRVGPKLQAAWSPPNAPRARSPGNPTAPRR